MAFVWAVGSIKASGKQIGNPGRQESRMPPCAAMCVSPLNWTLLFPRLPTDFMFQDMIKVWTRGLGFQRAASSDFFLRMSSYF